MQTELSLLRLHHKTLRTLYDISGWNLVEQARLLENALKAGFKSPQRWINQMRDRGWTPEEIDEAIAYGDRFEAPNNLSNGRTATRYVNPTTGRSVVIDDQTGEILHVGGDGFGY